MKGYVTIGLLIVFFPLPFVGQTTFIPGVITPRISCLADSTQHYALFLPSNYSEDLLWPVIFMFEPGARALLPLGKYQGLAEKYGYVMLSSYNSGNGPNEPIFEAANAMYTDAFKRFSLDEERVCLSGFSGGARIACLIALSNPGVEAVIGCGAGFPFSQLPEEPISFDYCGIIGKQDMNFTEMTLLDSTLNQVCRNHVLLTFPKGHQWPDTLRFRKAFLWLEASAMKTGKIPVREELLKEITWIYQQEISCFETGNNLPDLARSLNNVILLLDGLADVTPYREKLDQLTRSPSYDQALQGIYKNRGIEFSLQKKYITEFEEISLRSLDPEHPVRPESWWKKEFDRIDAIDDPDLRARLREFVINGSWEQHFNSRDLKRFASSLAYLDVYEAGLPGDPSPDYYKAIIQALSGNQEAMYRHLEKSTEKGFSNPDRITGEEAFRPWLDKKKMKKVLEKMK